jgi:membrane protein
VGLSDRLDLLQQRYPALGFPVAVVYKYCDDQGSYLAALIAYYAFISLFPLLLLLSTVLGWVLPGHPELRAQVEHSALSEFPVIGPQLGKPKQLSGGVVGILVGVLGALYGGLGGAQALQNAMNTAWTVPRSERPDPFRARGRSLLLLATGDLALLGIAVRSALGGVGLAGVGAFGVGAKVVALAASVAVNAGVFILAFRISTARHLTMRQVALGAVAAAVGWQVLKSFGGVYIGHVVKSASAINAVFALVLGMLAFLYIAATLVVLCAEINVVRVERLYPRALLTPFTDNVDLTAGDRSTYAAKAEAERTKGFEKVNVTFGIPPHRTAPESCDPPTPGALSDEAGRPN